MITYNNVKKEDIKDHHQNWPQILDLPDMIIGGSGSGKSCINLIKKQDHDGYSIINKIYLCFKDPNKGKYQYLIKKREKIGLENLKNPKSFIEYSNNMQDAFRNIEEHNPGRKCNVLIIFDGMIDMISNKKLNQIVTESFIRGRKINISTVFIT